MIDRDPDAGRWQPRRPLRSLGAVVVAAMVGCGAAVLDYHWRWTPVQRTQLRTYVRASVRTATGAGPATYHLPGARAAARYYNPGVADHLRRTVYGGRTLRALAWPYALVGLLALAVGLVRTIPRDHAAARDRRHGKRLKGPVLLAAADVPRGDGLIIRQARGAPIRLARRTETSHLLALGDTGTGKSSLIRQILQQVDARGETAIVYDPAREYLPQFYREARGDVILNPLDARCPYWSPGAELQSDAEAMTMAAALFPKHFGDSPFFAQTAQQIFAHLLTFRPSAADLHRWLVQPQALDARVAGTPYAVMIDPTAPAQRSGVLATLSLVAQTLALLPEPRGRRPWSAAAWAPRRQGWLFLVTAPTERTRVIPLMTLWMDLLILRLMHGQPAADRPTWIVIDELASIGRLPQLETAMTESRKAGVAMVLGFQAKSQMEQRYGPTAEAMLSQPATKVLFRTSEARSAEWVSKVIGDIETERVKESRSRGPGRDRWSETLERTVRPLILPSEIQGLPDLQGFLKTGNVVSPIAIPYVTRPARVPAFVPRPGPGAPRTAPSPPVELPPGDDPEPVTDHPVLY